MKKGILIVAGAVMLMATALLGGCQNKKAEALQSQVDSLHTTDSLHQEDIKSMTDFIYVMSTGLDSITTREGMITKGSAEGGKMDKAKLRAQLDGLSDLLNRQRQRISELETQMANNKSAYSERVKKLIAYYKQQLDEKDQQIAELNKQLDSKNADIARLNENVNTLTTTNTELSKTVDAQKSTIEAQEKSLYKAYVAIGTSKELKARGILKGGFLQKTKVDMAGLNPQNFKTVDTRTYNDITLESGNPRLMTHMPSASYTISKNVDNTTTLHIIDQKSFWSFSKYLVIKL